MSTGDWWTLAGYLTGIAVYLWASTRLWPGQRPQGWQSAVVLAAGLAGGLSGAKLVQVALSGWQQNSSALHDPQAGGRTIIGGLLAGWISVEIAKWCMGVSRSAGGPFALAIPAGEAVGRIGCWLNGCCYGAACNLPKGLPFTVEQHETWRLPAQLYSSLACAAVFLALLRLSRRLGPAELFRAFLMFYGSARFLLEFARYRETLYWGLSLAQWVCLELALAGLIAQFLAGRRRTASM